MFQTKISLLLASLCLVLSLNAQQKDIRFKRITINDGLSVSSVYCIFQDSKGFMWFGTEDGLNRYDGKNFIIYRGDTNKAQDISYKWIEQIKEDSEGNLWFGSRGGLTRFNPVNEKFEQFRGVGKDPALSNDTITCLFEDSNKRIWIGTLNGINCIDMEKRTVLSARNQSLLNARINCFFKGKNNNFWVGTNKGLFLYKSDKNQFEEWKLDKKQTFQVKAISLQDNHLLVGTNRALLKVDLNLKDKTPEVILKGLSIENILNGNSDHIWVSTSKMLLHFDKKGKMHKIVKSFESTNSLSVNTNKPIIKSTNGEIWFGTYGSGLFRILPDKKEKLNYTSNSADGQSLSQNSINCIYEDKSGVIWIGTFGAGISIYDPKAHKFDLFKHNALNENSLASNFIWSICEDSNNDVWIGTNDRGVSRYVSAQDTFLHYDFRISVKKAHTAIRKVYEDSKGNIWIGTDGDGLIKMNPETNRRTTFKYEAGNKSSISNNSVRVIFEDKQNNIWVGTRDGLNLYEGKRKFKQFKHDDLNKTSISHNFVYSCIFEDSKGLIWIGTYGGGLSIYNREKDEFTPMQTDGTFNCISDDIVFSVYEAPDGTFWIGTNNKLNHYNPVSKEFKHFGTNEGLPNNVIYGILPDENNHLWLSTNAGVCKFSLKDYSVQNFDVHDGLQSNEFNGGAFHKGKSGMLYFGGVYGLNVIDPGKTFPEEKLYDVVITKFAIHGQELQVSQGDSINNNAVVHLLREDLYYSSKSIPFAEELQLEYKDRFISLEFSTLSNFSPDRVNYAYRLKGLEEKWVYTGKRNYASYANLSPGTYTFQVRAQNPVGKWSDTVRELKIRILPPFYLTWWFMLLALVVISCAFIFVYNALLNMRTNKILTSQNELIREANQQLRVSENNLKELVATKDKFFRIISHDLKNPFTSLLSISEMIHENYHLVEEDEKKTGVRKIHESVKHIFSLLENLLTWSRSQTGKIEFHPVEFSLSDLLEESVSLYKASADKKKIRLAKDCEKEVKVYADRNMCSAILRNLLNNAIKFSNPDTEIKLAAEANGKFVEIKVIDQGIGIAPENLDKLFRIDLKYKSQGTSGEKGTGLGLLLCKEFAEANGGKIWVESIPTVGSTFSFLIPSA
jgi:signal transduction histidine kinase/ligand-binding sensor domain-containing protein